MIIDFLDSNRPVAAVYHGLAALIKAAVLKGKRITAFTNAEEKLAMRSDTV